MNNSKKSAKCVYCLKSHSKTTFNSREHIVPQSLGRFSPLNPTIGGDVVCDGCNRMFSLLETNFIEDTIEGIFSQRLNLQRRGSITIRNNLYKVTRTMGFGDNFFNEMFPFLEIQDGKIVAVLKNQIKLKRPGGGYRIFFPESLNAVSKGSKKHKKLCGDIKNLSQKGIGIFGENDDDIKEMISILSAYGVSYVQKDLFDFKINPGDRLYFEEEAAVSLDRKIARVLIKIAFNYFAYCAND